MGTTGKVCKFEFTENTLFYCSRITWCTTRAHIHYILPALLILPKDSSGYMLNKTNKKQH